MVTQEHRWEQWADLQVGDAAEQAAFATTLARRQGWSATFAEHVFREYRKFLYLAITSRSTVLPPPPIKAAWDLHREFPSWANLPAGTEIERRISLSASLDETRGAYRAAFGQHPPESIWPSPPRSRVPARRSSWWLAGGLPALAMLAWLATILPALLFFAALGLAVLAIVLFPRHPRPADPDLERLASAVASGSGEHRAQSRSIYN